MARLTEGLLSGISGRVGPIVGSNWNGINYVRSRPHRSKSKSKQSTAQLEQQAKFSLATKFLQPMKDLTMVTFRDYAGKMTGFNNAISHTLKNAVYGIYPDLKIDYRLTLIAKGMLPNGVEPKVSSIGDDSIRFNWKDNSGMGIAKAEDKALLVVYCPELERCFYTFESAFRNAGTATLEVSYFQDRQVHTWIAFVSLNGKDISPSIYTGEVKIA